jgi:hypothetical protein
MCEWPIGWAYAFYNHFLHRKMNNLPPLSDVKKKVILKGLMDPTKAKAIVQPKAKLRPLVMTYTVGYPICTSDGNGVMAVRPCIVHCTGRDGRTACATKAAWTLKALYALRAMMQIPRGHPLLETANNKWRVAKPRLSALAAQHASKEESKETDDSSRASGKEEKKTDAKIEFFEDCKVEPILMLTKNSELLLHASLPRPAVDPANPTVPVMDGMLVTWQQLIEWNADHFKAVHAASSTAAWFDTKNKGALFSVEDLPAEAATPLSRALSSAQAMLDAAI